MFVSAEMAGFACFLVVRDTLFPLQGALGYDLMQKSFYRSSQFGRLRAPLTILSQSYFRLPGILNDDREVLDERWTIFPVGGADLVPSFIALLGNHLNVTVLVDTHRKGHQKLSHLFQ